MYGELFLVGTLGLMVLPFLILMFCHLQEQKDQQDLEDHLR
jgi:hypothetical protein